MPFREETFHYPYNKKIDDLERVVNSKRINFKPSMQNTPYFVLKNGTLDIGKVNSTATEEIKDDQGNVIGTKKYYIPDDGNKDKKYKIDPYTGAIQIKQKNNYNYWSSYEQGVIKTMDKTTELCLNRHTYIIVTAITDHTYDLDITLQSLRIVYDSATKVRLMILPLILSFLSFL